MVSREFATRRSYSPFSSRLGSSEVIVVLANPASFTVGLFVCLEGEGVLAVKVAREVSGTFTRFATISRVVFVDWEPTVTATSFPSAEMVIFLSLKLWKRLSPSGQRLPPSNKGVL